MIVLVACMLTAGIFALIRWGRQQPISLAGAVLVQDADSRRQAPIAGVTVSADDDLAVADCTSGSSGLFVLNLHKLVRRGHAITLHFRHPQYRPLDLNDFVSNKLYVVHLVPLSSTPSTVNQPYVKVSNVRVRYTLRATTTLNIGSAVKTFEVENRGNVPCNGKHPCSPDGRWKAAVGSASLDAGVGNEFRDARVSCIAGPCPFTTIEADHALDGSRIMTVSARDWSDTATFLLEAEVFRSMQTQSEHWSYPVIFGESLSFTLPSPAESVSIEADLDGQTIIFPVGPALFLSWAACSTAVNPDSGRVYRCTAKAGYRFQ